MRVTAISVIVFYLGVLAVYALHANAHAQPAAETSEKTAEEDGEKAGGKTVEEKIEMYGKLKTAGIALTSAGLVLTVPGIVLAIIGAVGTAMSFVIFDWDNMTGWAAMYSAGVIMIIVGSVALLAGMPCWIVGAVKKKKYNKMLAGLRPLFGYDADTRTWIAGMGLSF